MTLQTATGPLPLTVRAHCYHCHLPLGDDAVGYYHPQCWDLYWDPEAEEE